MRVVLLISILISSMNAMSQKTTLDSLQGYWQSEEDKGYIIEFTGRNEISFNNGEKTDSMNINLSDSCNNFNLNKNELNNSGGFLIEIEDDKTSCFEIVALLKNNLTLRYENSGHFLIFKRIKKLN